MITVTVDRVHTIAQWSSNCKQCKDCSTIISVNVQSLHYSTLIKVTVHSLHNSTMITVTVHSVHTIAQW
jgi:hypothetical protein